MPPLSIGPSMNGLVAYASSIDREQTRRQSASGHSADSLPNSGTLPLPGADGEHSYGRRIRGARSFSLVPLGRVEMARPRRLRA